jgi:hypothetical protein
MNVEKQLRRMVEKIGAEKVAVSITYDQNSWWQKRNQETYPFDVVIEWEDGEEKLRIGDRKAKTLAAALEATEAELNGILLRKRSGE